MADTPSSLPATGANTPEPWGRVDVYTAGTPSFAHSVAAPTSPLAIGPNTPELCWEHALPTGEEIAAALRRFSYSREGGGRRASLGDSFILPPEQTEVEAEIFCVARRLKNIGSSANNAGHCH